MIVDEHLLAPSKSVPDKAAGDLHAVDLLVVERDDHGERISDADVLCNQTVGRFAGEDAHVAARHGSSGGERCSAHETEGWGHRRVVRGTCRDGRHRASVEINGAMKG